MEPRICLSFRVPRDLAKAVDAAAKTEKRTRAGMARVLLERALLAAEVGNG